MDRSAIRTPFRVAAGARIDDDRCDAPRRKIDRKRQDEACQKSGNVRLPRDAGTVNVMIEIEDQNADVGAHQLHPGFSEFKTDRKERAEEPEDCSARADRRTLRIAEIDDS